MIYDIRDFGALPDGRTLCTKAVQKAVDVCAENGGIIRIAEGKYVLGTVFLKSNITLVIEDSAEINTF